MNGKLVMSCAVVIVAMLVAVVGAKDIPTNPAKGSQYGNSVGRAILVITGDVLWTSLRFEGVVNKNTLVLGEDTRHKDYKGASESPAKPRFYIPIESPFRADDYRDYSIQRVSPAVWGGSRFLYEGYDLLVRITKDGMYAFVDVLGYQEP
jgi:hypothetical protein